MESDKLEVLRRITCRENDTLSFVNEWFNSSPVVTAHTSGSTGKPKNIKLLKSDMLKSAMATNRFFGINSDSVLACPLSSGYIAGKMMIVRAIAAGCRMIAATPSNRFDLPESNRISLIAIVPSQLEHTLNRYGDRTENILVGGAPLSVEQQNLVSQYSGNVYLSYGMTETCSHVALKRVGTDGAFRALPGISFDIDTRGCLIINAPGFSFSGTVTNDIVELRDECSFVWRGRYDNVINSGGIKVYPEEIEQKIAYLCNIGSQFYITKRAHAKWGEIPVLVIKTTDELDIQDIATEIRNVLSKAERPKEILVTDKIETIGNGKIRRILPPEVLARYSDL